MTDYITAAARDRIAQLWQSSADYAADAPVLVRLLEDLVGRVEALEAQRADTRAPAGEATP